MTAVQSNPVLERHIPMLEGWYLEYRSCQFDKAQVGPQSRLQHRAILHPASCKRSACIACECYLALHTPAKAVRCFDFLALPAGLLCNSGGQDGGHSLAAGPPLLGLAGLAAPPKPITLVTVAMKLLRRLLQPTGCAGLQHKGTSRSAVTHCCRHVPITARSAASHAHCHHSGF